MGRCLYHQSAGFHHIAMVIVPWSLLIPEWDSHLATKMLVYQEDCDLSPHTAMNHIHVARKVPSDYAAVLQLSVFVASLTSQRLNLGIAHQ